MTARIRLPDGAWTVLQYCRPIRGLPVADARFIAATGKAASLYGEESPEKLCLRYVSETRPRKHHIVGAVSSVLRKQGHYASPAYIAVIERPDGEQVLVRKTTVHCVGVGNGQTWLTHLERVREGEPAPAPSLEENGLNELDYEAVWMKYTMADALQWIDSPLPVYIPEKLRDIIGALGDVRKLASDDVSYSLQTGVVKYRQECRKCHHLWYSTRQHPAQCPVRECAADVATRKRPRRARASRSAY